MTTSADRPKTLTGSCLCKKVGITITPEHHSFHACHCGMCRTWTGSSLLAVNGDADQVSFTGEKNIKSYQSSSWAERGFCQNCGTHLFYKLNSPVSYEIPIGLLDEVESLTFGKQIFHDSKPSNYSFAEPTENLDEAQTYAWIKSML